MDRPFPVGERAADKTRDPKLKITLLALPADLVHHVLMRDEIRDLELCRLECTAWLMKSLVDEAAWCRAFLQRRRGNVLRQPARTEATAATGEPKRIAPQAVTAAAGEPKRIAPQVVTADGPERVLPTPVEPARRVVPVPIVEVGEKRPIDSVDGEAEEKKPQRIAPTPM